MEELLKLFGNLNFGANQKIVFEVDKNGKMSVHHEILNDKVPQNQSASPAPNQNLKTKAQIKQEIDVLVSRKQLAEQKLKEAELNIENSENQLYQYENICSQIESYIEQQENNQLSLEEEICFLSDELQKAMNQRSAA